MQSCDLFTIPSDNLVYILSYLSPCKIMRILTTCSDFYNIVHANLPIIAMHRYYYPCDMSLQEFNKQEVHHCTRIRDAANKGASNIVNHLLNKKNIGWALIGACTGGHLDLYLHLVQEANDLGVTVKYTNLLANISNSRLALDRAIPIITHLINSGAVVTTNILTLLLNHDLEFVKYIDSKVTDNRSSNKLILRIVTLGSLPLLEYFKSYIT